MPFILENEYNSRKEAKELNIEQLRILKGDKDFYIDMSFDEITKQLKDKVVEI